MSAPTFYSPLNPHAHIASLPPSPASVHPFVPLPPPLLHPVSSPLSPALSNNPLLPFDPRYPSHSVYLFTASISLAASPMKGKRNARRRIGEENKQEVGKKRGRGDLRLCVASPPSTCFCRLHSPSPPSFPPTLISPGHLERAFASFVKCSSLSLSVSLDLPPSLAPLCQLLFLPLLFPPLTSVPLV